MAFTSRHAPDALTPPLSLDQQQDRLLTQEANFSSCRGSVFVAAKDTCRTLDWRRAVGFLSAAPTHALVVCGEGHDKVAWTVVLIPSQ
jgi:hypothetical protein